MVRKRIEHEDDLEKFVKKMPHGDKKRTADVKLDGLQPSKLGILLYFLSNAADLKRVRLHECFPSKKETAEALEAISKNQMTVKYPIQLDIRFNPLDARGIQILNNMMFQGSLSHLSLPRNIESGISLFLNGLVQCSTRLKHFDLSGNKLDRSDLKLIKRIVKEDKIKYKLILEGCMGRNELLTEADKLHLRKAIPNGSKLDIKYFDVGKVAVSTPFGNLFKTVFPQGIDNTLRLIPMEDRGNVVIETIKAVKSAVKATAKATGISRKKHRPTKSQESLSSSEESESSDASEEMDCGSYVRKTPSRLINNSYSDQSYSAAMQEPCSPIMPLSPASPATSIHLHATASDYSPDACSLSTRTYDFNNSTTPLATTTNGSSLHAQGSTWKNSFDGMPTQEETSSLTRVEVLNNTNSGFESPLTNTSQGAREKNSYGELQSISGRSHAATWDLSSGAIPKREKKGGRSFLNRLGQKR